MDTLTISASPVAFNTKGKSQNPSGRAPSSARASGSGAKAGRAPEGKGTRFAIGPLAHAVAWPSVTECHGNAIDGKRAYEAWARAVDLSIQEQVSAKRDSHREKRIEHQPLYVRACREKSWSLVLWKKSDPGQKRVVCFKCQSWRCQGDCAKTWGKQMFARIVTAFKGQAPETITFNTFTFDPKQFNAKRGYSAQEMAFLESGRCWSLLRRRLGRRFGKLEFVAVAEQHKSGFPHFHVAIVSKKYAAWVAKDKGHGKREKKAWLEPLLEECGFGRVSDVDLARNHEAVAGYIVKMAFAGPLPGELTKDSQLPLIAPRGFRRIRASVGFLPKKFKNEEVTGKFLQASTETVGEVFEGKRAMSRERARLRSLAAARLAGVAVDSGTGEVVTDLLGNVVEGEVSCDRDLQGNSVRKAGRCVSSFSE